jgi:hypothetical protein
MRIDFTPRFFRDPQADAQAAAEQVKQVEKLTALYQKVDELTEAEAKNLAEAAKQSGNINKEVARLEKYLEDITFQSDYLYRSFQESTAELTKQNNLLKIGKSTFKDLTSVAQDLTYFQRGISDLNEKQFKKLQSTLSMRQEDLELVEKMLGNGKGEYNQQEKILRIQNLLKTAEGDKRKELTQRLNDLKEEEKLYNVTKNALDNEIILYQKELDISKQIFDVREKVGGISTAVAKQISEFAGPLASFLNITDAVEAVEEHNKKLVKAALEDEAVQKRLLEIDRKKQKLQAQLEGTKDENKRKQILEEISGEETKAYNIKSKAIAGINQGFNGLKNKFTALIVLSTEMGKSLLKGFQDPLFYLTKAIEANKQVVELGKQIGYGAGKAELLRENIAEVARNSYNMNVTAASATEAFGQLAQSTGFVSEFTADQLETQVKLTKQVGLQADEASQVQRFAVLNGKTSEETYKSFVRGLAVTRNQLKVGINFRAALAEATKVSGQLAANLGYNPERIAKAIVTAKAFGMTLEQVAKSGESLLNFESSIESELKAELLTGQQLNLERARAAALAGDQVTLAEELAKNVGTAADFTKMNVLQQKALAESVGMTSDQLSETLRKREEAIASGKSLAQVTEEEAAKALERQNIQEKFNAAMLKLQDIVGNLIAGPLGALLDVLSVALKIVNLIAEPFRLISSLINSIIPAGNAFGTVLKGILFTTIGIMTFINPIKSLLSLALLGGAIMGVKALTKGNDVISPGYGKRAILSPEGTIALNNNDTVVAGTNLSGGESSQAIQGPSIDLTPMIVAINEVKAAVDGLMNRPVVINMDGKQVGSNLVQGSYKLA